MVIVSMDHRTFKPRNFFFFLLYRNIELRKHIQSLSTKLFYFPEANLTGLFTAVVEFGTTSIIIRKFLDKDELNLRVFIIFGEETLYIPNIRKTFLNFLTLPLSLANYLVNFILTPQFRNTSKLTKAR